MTQSVVTGGSLRIAFGQALVDLAPAHDFFVVDCDVAGGTGVDKFRGQYSPRFIQAGIAEQAGVGLAAGLNVSTGKPVFFTTFATFGARAFEIARLAVAHDNRHVIITLSHVGLDVGPDGSSAQSLEHYALWRSLPDMTVIHPCDALEMRQVVEWTLTHPGPIVLFTGRSPTSPVLPPDYQFEPGKIRSVAGLGRDAFIFACGHQVSQAIEAEAILGNSYGIEVSVFNVSTLKPIDAIELTKLAGECSLWFTCEDHSLYGGLNGAICEIVSQLPGPAQVIPIGVNGWGQSGEPGELRAKYGLDGLGIAQRVLARLG